MGLRRRAQLAALILSVAAVTLLAGPLAQASCDYAGAVQADNPVIYYRLGETSGTVAQNSAPDDPGGARNGTYESNYTLNQSNAITCDTNKGASFTGGGRVRYAAGTGLPTGDAARTLEVWVKISVNNQTQHIMSYGSTGTRQFFGVRLEGWTHLEIEAGGSEELTFITPRPLNDNAWHHLAATYDGSQAVIYLDGQSLGSQTFTAALNTTLNATGFQLGRFDGTATGHFSGTADEVAVYPAALSATRIAAHFDASTNTRPTAPGSPAATAGTNQATVSWSAAGATVPSGQSAVTAYLVTALENGTTRAIGRGRIECDIDRGDRTARRHRLHVPRGRTQRLR